MKKYLLLSSLVALCNAFVFCFPAMAQPPFNPGMGVVTVNGQEITGSAPIPLGTVELGAAAECILWFHGDPFGGAPVTIEGITLMQTGAQYTLTENPTGATLNSYADSVRVKIGFVSSSPGTHTVSCLINTDNFTNMVQLSATTPSPVTLVRAGEATALGDTLWLGNVEVSQAAPFTIWFKNTSTASIPVDSVRMGTNAMFSLLQAPQSGAIASNDSAAIITQFSPQAVGDQLGIVTLYSGGFPYRFTLKATGIETTTGVDVPVNSQWKVYPNPTSNLVSVGGPQVVWLQLTDMQGKVVNTKADSGQANTVSLKEIPSGMYLLRWSDGTTTRSERIVRQ